MKNNKILLFIALVLAIGIGLFVFNKQRNERIVMEHDAAVKAATKELDDAALYARYLALDALKHMLGFGIEHYKMVDLFNLDTLEKIIKEDCHKNHREMQEDHFGHFKGKCETSLNVLHQYLNDHPEVQEYYKEHPSMLQY